MGVKFEKNEVCERCKFSRKYLQKEKNKAMRALSNKIILRNSDKLEVYKTKDLNKAFN